VIQSFFNREIIVASWPIVLAAFDLDLAGILLGLGLSGYLLLDVLPI